MKPVMQTVTGPRGNCMSACFASILELPIEAVPNFYEAGGESPGDWWAAIRSWLKPRGFGVITLTFEDAAMWGQLCLDGFHIVSGKSPRIEGAFHATVWHAGKLVHDPHPDQTGIVGPETLDMLYPLDAAALGVAIPGDVRAAAAGLGIAPEQLVADLAGVPGTFNDQPKDQK